MTYSGRIPNLGVFRDPQMMLILQDAMRTLLLTSLCLTVTIPAFAQYSDEIHHNNISVGGGAAIPVGSTSGYLNTASAFSVSYGYRVNRFFQADAGFQMAFGAANNQNLEQTDFGEVQGGDHEFMLPLGGRFIIPLPFRKLEASAGGGGVYLHYAETAPSGGMRGIQATATRVRHEAVWEDTVLQISATFWTGTGRSTLEPHWSSLAAQRMVRPSPIFRR